MKPSFLVIDGYTKKAREELGAAGATTAGIQYKHMLKNHSPKCNVDIIYPSDKDSVLPKGAALTQYDGIAWTGCSLCVFDKIPEVRIQIDLAREAFKAKIPSFGSCWAAQIAVVAAGGTVNANPKGREMGVARKIILTPEGAGHPMYHGKACVFDAFISHVDEITHLPSGSIRLSGNTFTNVQSVSVNYQGGTFWGLQYHPEYNLYEMARLIWCRMNKLIELGFYKNQKALKDHVALLEILYKDPSRKDIAWVLGIDGDVMDQAYRQIEVQNWIQKLVFPNMIIKG